MKLYMVPLAPNPTKVMLYIAERAELGTDMGIEQIVVNTVKGRHKEPEHLARNPFGTLPVLEFDDGSFLVESLAIMEYLEEQFPDNALRPSGPRERAQHRDVERIVDLRVAKQMGTHAHATNSPLGRPPNPELAAQMEAELETPMNYLEGLLADGRPYLLGDQVSFADFTLQASLQFLRFVKVDLFGDRPLLRAYDERYRARPGAQAVLKW